MATMRVWAGSALLLFFFFFRAYADGNDSLSLDSQPVSPTPVTTTLTSAETDGEITTDKKITTEGEITDGDITTVGMTASKLTVQATRKVETILDTSTRFSTRANDFKKKEGKNEEIKWDNKWDEPFKYDYSSLKNAGLTIAAVLFLLGIMVITCGKMRCRRGCHMSKGRSYEVTRM